MKNDFYQFRPNWYHNSKRHQLDFQEWLLKHNADIYKNDSNTLLKFKIGKEFGYVYVTGMCCKVFRKYLSIYKRELSK